jgi:hypothetical protein
MVYVLHCVCWFFTTIPVLAVWGRCARLPELTPGKRWTVKIRFTFSSVPDPLHFGVGLDPDPCL